MAATSATVHASAVLIGARAVLIRGPSGSGKSRLAFELIEAARTRSLFARLVADDRAHLERFSGRLLVRPAEALAGLIEVRGVGIIRFAYEPRAVVALAVDLAAADGARIPQDKSRTTEIAGIALPRLPVAVNETALPPVLALITSSAGTWI